MKKFKGQDYNSMMPGFKLFIMEPKYIYVELDCNHSEPIICNACP